MTIEDTREAIGKELAETHSKLDRLRDLAPADIDQGELEMLADIDRVLAAIRARLEAV